MFSSGNIKTAADRITIFKITDATPTEIPAYLYNKMLIISEPPGEPKDRIMIAHPDPDNMPATTAAKNLSVIGKGDNGIKSIAE